MSGQGRLGDKAQVPVDAHGCPACPHPGVGPAIQGSPDVFVNRRPALRIDDPGLHAACCSTNRWTASSGSTTVFINGKAAHRMGDQTRHCGGMGQLMEGSPNVLVGETTAASMGASPRRIAGHGGNRHGAGAERDLPAVAERPAQAVPPRASPTSYIEISLVDQHGEPFVGERYRVVVAGDQIREGVLDGNGKVRVEEIEPGICDVTFPDLPADDWRLA